MKSRQAPAVRMAVLASGNGSNLQAIIDRVKSGTLAVNVALVISDQPRARALERARAARIETRLISPVDFSGPEDWNEAISSALTDARIDFVVLAGFMRIIGTAVLDAFPGRILNIHPSILPKYPGLDTYARVLAAGDKEHGTSVHFVTEQLDGGPLIAQAVIPVSKADDEQSLRTRIQATEHWLYPLVLGWIASGRVVMRESATWLDGKRLAEPLRFTEDGPDTPATAVRPAAT